MTPTRIQIRRDTAAAWTAANPILLAGEPAQETDTGKQKTGDGTTAWTSLPYRPQLDAPNTFSADQSFHRHVVVDAGTGIGGGWPLTVLTPGGALATQQNKDISSASNNPADSVNIFHKSTGDAIFVAHQGGVLPATFTFTADTASGTPTLATVSSFTGLTVGTPITGAGIPAGTSIKAYNIGASTITMGDSSGNSVNATATATGITVTVTRPSGSSGGNSALNVLIPYNLDDASTGWAGNVVNNRDGMNGLLIQSGALNNTRAPVEVWNWANAPVMKLVQQDASHPAGTHGGIIDAWDNGTGASVTIRKGGAPGAGVATLTLVNSTTGPVVIPMLRSYNNADAIERIGLDSDGHLRPGDTSGFGGTPFLKVNSGTDPLLSAVDSSTGSSLRIVKGAVATGTGAIISLKNGTTVQPALFVEDSTATGRVLINSDGSARFGNTALSYSVFHQIVGSATGSLEALMLVNSHDAVTDSISQTFAMINQGRQAQITATSLTGTPTWTSRLEFKILVANALATRFAIDSTGVGFFGVTPAAKQVITGALSTVTDAAAKAVLTSIISALSTPGLVTNSTT